MKKAGVIIGIIVVLALLLIPQYNGLVQSKENVNEAYAQVQNVVQRRADLIPNLVSTAKGFAKHEEDVFIKVSEARSGVKNAKDPQELAKANDELTSALNGMNVVVERYPELKSDTHFTQLMDELAGSENRIATERKNYNTVVKTYNQKVKRFPTVIFARLMGFSSEKYFEADASAQKAPQVNFE